LLLAGVSEVARLLLGQGVIIVILELTDGSVRSVPVPRARTNGADRAVFLHHDDFNPAPEQGPEFREIEGIRI
jgi:hypothetical protein